jgi:cysteinyl-tRNA synthetase
VHFAKFEEAMDDDFNSAAALGTVFVALSDLNKAVASPTPSAEDIAGFAYTVRSLLGCLGVEIPPMETVGTDGQADELIEYAIAWRKQARAAKQYGLSDQIRDDLKKMGIILEDRPQGTTWQRE